MQGKQSNKTALIYMTAVGAIIVVILALHIAPHAGSGLPGILAGLGNAADSPFDIVLCKDSLKTVFICLLIYGVSIGAYLSTRRNYRRGEEHGSAKWGDATAVNRKYREKKTAEANKLLTQNVSMGLDGRKHRRNLNTVVVGGSGAGKTRSYAKPNIMQCSGSMVVLDPKGEILRDTGGLLKARGYEIRVLDVIEPWRSHSYNPFAYIRNDDDIQRISTLLMKATEGGKSRSNGRPVLGQSC